MRILVLTDPYGKPSFGPRLRYFCEDWIRRGHTVRVITEEFETIPFTHSYPIDRIPIYRNRPDWVIKSAWSLLTDWKNRYFSRQVQQLVSDEQYDLVFCTTFSTFPLRAASDIARIKKIPLHVDLRDLDEQVPGAQYQSHRGTWTRLFRTWYRNVNIRRRNRVLRQADSLSTVSPWHVDFVRTFQPNVHLIYNGYDPEQFYFAPVQTDEFLVSYIGKIYDFQHPEPLLDMLRTMPGVTVNLHTPTDRPIPITAVGDEIRRSSVMIVLTDPSAKGMMTTKFYEALGCEKPIICFPSDHGLLAQTIQETHAGIASDDLNEIRQWVETKQKEWQQQRFTHQDSLGIAPFSRSYQSERLHQVLRETTQRPRPLVADICWTLYRANTTFAFLDHVIHDKAYLRLRRWMQYPWVRYANLLVLKVTHRDLIRSMALRYLNQYTPEQVEQMADSFVQNQLEQQRIEPVWQQLQGREIIVVSGTIAPIAEAVGKRLGAKKIYSGDIFKKQALTELTHYDIVTDNLSDKELVRRAKQAYIVSYGNRDRWIRLGIQHIKFIADESSRY